MGPRATIRGAVAIAGVAAALLFTAGTAHAAPAAPAAAPAGNVVLFAPASAPAQVSVGAPSDAEDPIFTPQATYTFSHARSQALYNAALGVGVVGVTALCLRYAPPPFNAGCAAAAPILVALLANGLASNECYQLYTKWTPPFWGARIANC